MKKSIVKEVYRIHTKIGEDHYKIVSAIVNGQLHYTADVRKIGDNLWAVFSDITLYDDKFWGGVDGLIKLGEYFKTPQEVLSIEEDYYIWVKIKDKDDEKN